MNQIHFRTCNLCEAMCGIQIEYEKKEIKTIKGDKNDPFSRGYICPKAVALQDIYNDPDRLKRPIKKTETGWKEISWNEAFDSIESNIKSIQKKHGSDAVGAFLGNPNVHNFGSILFGPAFLRSLKSKNIYSATSVDQLPHHFVCQEMYGNPMFIPVPDIDNTDLFIIMGANPMASNGSMMTAAGMPRRLKAILDRDGKFIVIDPRKTETAKKASEYIPIRPGTDVFLLLAMINTIVSENLMNLTLSSHLSIDLSELHQNFQFFDAKKAGEITDIDPEKIVLLSREFAKTQKAVIYGRMGLSVQKYGNLCQWLIQVLNIITGKLDCEGGSMFPLPAVVMSRESKRFPFQSKYNRWQSRVHKLAEFRGELPVCTLVDEITTEGKGQIKAMITAAGNPVLSTPNGKALEKALHSLEFMVSIDIYINETTRHADIILPPTTGLETDHYDLVFHNLAVRNTAKFSQALFNPSPGAKHDWEIFKELTRRFDSPPNWIDRLKQRWINPARMINIALKRGPYTGLSISKLIKHPHGIDLGPLKPGLPERLFTKDKKINLLPELLLSDLKRAKAEFIQFEGISDRTLQLIGRRELRSNNSWMHNSKRLMKGPKRCTLLMHPDDAESRKLKNNESVLVQSETGELSIPLEITPDIKPGVISIPHGYGHHREGVIMKIAQLHAGVSYNDLTNRKEFDPLTGNAILNGIAVNVSSISQ